MNKRIAGRLAGALGLLLALSLLGSIATPVLALPQMPHQFWGTVTIGGSAAPAGTVITAKITGAPDATTTTGSGGSYNLMVPADDPDTSAKEGGVAGDPIQFYVGTTAAQTSTFAYGGITNLPLTIAAPPPSAAQKLIGADDATASGDGNSGYLVYSRFQAVASGNMTEFRIKSSVSGHVKVAIYTDVSGAPGTLITANNTSQAVSAGWNSLTFPSTAITSGTYYWLVAIQDAYGCMQYKATGTMKYKTGFTYSSYTFPSSPETGLTDYPAYELFAGWGTTVAPVVPAVPTRNCSALTFKWNAATGATKYHLQVNTSSGFTGTDMFNAEVGNVLYGEVTGLTAGTTYYWRVKAGNSAGWSDWSTPTGNMRCE